MINLVKEFFEKSVSADEISKGEEGEHDIRVATCAILLKMANIDGEFSEKEQEGIVSLLKKDFDLSD